MIRPTHYLSFKLLPNLIQCIAQFTLASRVYVYRYLTIATLLGSTTFHN